MTHLIVNADDLGLSRGINRGIIEAHCRGIVTSASLMVRWPAAAEAAAACRDVPRLGLGLHVDLGEWAYRDGDWSTVYHVVDLQDRRAVACEVAQQLESFRTFVGRDPTHLDSHQHVHLEEPARSVLRDMATRLSVPLRRFTPYIRCCGDFYGQTERGDSLEGNISVEALTELIARLPAGVTELCCHPGLDDDVDTMYRRERCREVATLCDPRVRAAIAARQIELCTFQDVGCLPMADA